MKQSEAPDRSESAQPLMARFGSGLCPFGAINSACAFTLHTTAAALMALTVAYLFGIHHPWWAAMTVWLVAQPTRGLFIERCAARLAGTAVGAAFGGSILVLYFDRPGVLVALLIGWVMLCAGVGNLLRHFRTYGAVLAGYTATIVCLFGLTDQSSDINLATGRVACTIIGILCSTLFSAPFQVATDFAALNQRVREVTARCIQWCGAPQRSRNSDQGIIERDELLHLISQIDLAGDQISAGSLRGRTLATETQAAVYCAIETMGLASIAERTRQPSDAVAEGCQAAGFSRQLIEARIGHLTTGTTSPCPRRYWSALDFPEIVKAALKPASALSLAYLLWTVSSWTHGPVMAMTATLFASLFSSHATPAAALRDVFYGSVAGAIGGLLCRFVLMPQIGSYGALLAVIAPFLMVGAFLMTRPKTAKMAIDINMTFLLVAQPSFPVPLGGRLALEQVAAILLGVAIAMAVYAASSSSNPLKKRRRLERRLISRCELIASSPLSVRVRRYQQAIIKYLLTLASPHTDRSAIATQMWECLGWSTVIAELAETALQPDKQQADFDASASELEQATQQLRQSIAILRRAT